MPAGDTYNTYYRLWDRLSRRRRCIVQHGASAGWDETQTPTEWGRLHGAEARERDREAVNRTDEDMRYFDIDVALAVEGADNVG